MDKFGIFNLLNAFFDYYKENGDKNSPENLSENDLKPLGFNSVFGKNADKFFSLFKPSEKKENPVGQNESNAVFAKSPAKKGKSSSPVGTPCLNPLFSASVYHDKFVERVKNAEKRQ